jgi:hypothetical protein
MESGVMKFKDCAGEPESFPRDATQEAASLTRAIVGRGFSYGQDFSYDDDVEIEVETVEDSARYIADMIASLAYIARDAKLDLLTYLLDMARVEAEMQARQSETPDDD